LGDSELARRVIDQAIARNGALLKVISRNDVGVTGGHQCGFHLPKSAWSYFAPFGPVKGRNDAQGVLVRWPDGTTTKSVVTWYGAKSRSEYRLTRFGRNFRFRHPDDVGAVLVLIRTDDWVFDAHVLRAEQDIEAVAVALGLDPCAAWSQYLPAPGRATLADDELQPCLDSRFAKIAAELKDFPSGDSMSLLARDALANCRTGYGALSPDERLALAVEAEFKLFKVIEERLTRGVINGPFESIDRFLEVANTLLQRRKSRAGRSLENHVGALLRDAGIPHVVRADIRGRPDIVVPSVEAYRDEGFPEDRLFVIAVKTTCRDRWRQVLEEGPRVNRRYLVTTQRGMSIEQMNLMHAAGIVLVVPKRLMSEYPAQRDLMILSIEAFLGLLRSAA
jgi:EcoRII C terminal/Restriction endonuclease EcoRII, N-terminal